MCDCPEARAWREYWTREAIAERLERETELYRKICHERWTAACQDARAPAARLHLGGYPSHAELVQRRAQPGEWPPAQH